MFLVTDITDLSPSLRDPVCHKRLETLVLLFPISEVGIRCAAVEDILETSHDTELTETAVTSQMIVTHHSLVGLFLDIRSVKELSWKNHLETYRHGRTGQHLAPGQIER